MRKLITLGTAVCALALPAVANAGGTVSPGDRFLIPGATYTGEFLTGTPGGTVSIVVSEDGSNADFSAAGFGHGLGGDCNENSLGREDVAITDGALSYVDFGPPSFISIFGTFDRPGIINGSARINGICDSGTQSWGATTPVPWTDLTIRRSNESSEEGRGNNVYNGTAINQSISQGVKRGKARSYKIDLQGDGTVASSPTIEGCRSSRGFAVKYRFAGSDITGEVTGTGFTIGKLGIRETETVLLSIRASKKVKKGKTKACKVTSTTPESKPVDPQVDAVKATVKAR